MDATTFPISFPFYLIFCIVACIFFAWQFYKNRKYYQLILAIAIPLSLVIFAQPENKVLYHIIGLVELIALIAALVVSIIQKSKDAKKND